MAKRSKRRKNDNSNIVMMILIVLGIGSIILKQVINYKELVTTFVLLIIASWLGYKMLQKKRRERIRQELLRYNSMEQKKQIQKMITIINNLLSMQKHKLNTKEKEKKAILNQKYNDYYHFFPPGFVYIVQEKGSNQVKIGKGKNPLERITKGFGVKMPYILEVLHLIPTTSDLETERWLHSYFEKKRTNGEWFQLSHSDIEWLKSGDYPLELLGIITKAPR